jgi:hypothetical protein
MASRDNPFLARAVVNRVWSHLFGRGLVEPVDDISDQNPASDPQLFQELTDRFVQSGFNLRELFRTLTFDQRIPADKPHSGGFIAPPELFTRMATKTLTSEQLYDCLDQVLMQQPREKPRAFLAGGARCFRPAGGGSPLPHKCNCEVPRRPNTKPGVLQSTNVA